MYTQCKIESSIVLVVHIRTCNQIVQAKSKKERVKVKVKKSLINDLEAKQSLSSKFQLQGLSVRKQNRQRHIPSFSRPMALTSSVCFFAFCSILCSSLIHLYPAPASASASASVESTEVRLFFVPSLCYSVLNEIDLCLLL